MFHHSIWITSILTAHKSLDIYENVNSLRMFTDINLAKIQNLNILLSLFQSFRKSKQHCYWGDNHRQGIEVTYE